MESEITAKELKYANKRLKEKLLSLNVKGKLAKAKNVARGNNMSKKKETIYVHDFCQGARKKNLDIPK